MKKSIFIKIFSGYFLITLSLSSLIFILSIQTIRSFYIHTLSNNLENVAKSLHLKIASSLEENVSSAGLNRMINTIGREINTRITIISLDGTVLADSEEDPRQMENHGKRPEILDAYAGKTGQSLRFSNTLKEDMLYVAIPLRYENEIKGVVRVSLFVSRINVLFSSLIRAILKIALIITVLSLAGALLFSRGLTRPISDLTLASQKVAKGDFNVQVNLEDKSELRLLAESFNYMTARIKHLFNEITRQKEEINNIVNSIHEGLLVVDRDNKIRFANDNMSEILNKQSIVNLYLKDIISESILLDLIDKARRDMSDLVKNIAFDEKHFFCSITFTGNNDEVIILLHEITEIVKLEQIKKDFVANVSHELKTPLTAVKGYIETLEEEEDIKNKTYVEIIKRHTDRLILIVKDLLVLSELEKREFSLQVRPVNLEKFINNIIKIYEPKIKEKKFKIHFNFDSSLPKIPIDPFRMEQVFINILDNAIKYTEKGGIELYVYKKENDQENVFISVSDNGIGIPQEHLSRIFERFYVIDKARSRKMGGTGLGLSIVKHIVQLHNGTISVNSSEHKGTTFIISLPLSS